MIGGVRLSHQRIFSIFFIIITAEIKIGSSWIKPQWKCVGLHVPDVTSEEELLPQETPGP